MRVTVFIQKLTDLDRISEPLAFKRGALPSIGTRTAGNFDIGAGDTDKRIPLLDKKSVKLYASRKLTS
jgi:hypothetical protein